jgi:dTDP-4-amino-4,6-dideoxygalactose transaminase
LAQIKKLPDFFKHKEALWKTYEKQMQALEPAVTLTQSFDARSLLHIYPVLIARGISRDRVRESLSKVGIETGIHYVPNHRHTFFKTPYDLPVTDDMTERLLSLPFHVGVSEPDIEQVTGALRKALTAAKI